MLPPRLMVPPAVLEVSGGCLDLGGFNLSQPASPRLLRLVERIDALTDGEGPEVDLRIHCGCESVQVPPADMDESYSLVVDSSGVRITASEEWGAVRALSLIANLLEDGRSLPYLNAEDSPRHAWRGLMLDPARRFLSIDALKRTLAGMWVCRLNVLHLHLSDDQGLRIPLLGRVPEAAHYSRQELRGLVDFAADLGIRIIPEIDLPGHATGLLVSFPDWARGDPPESCSKRFGVHAHFVDCARGEVREGLEAMIGELAEVFPDTYLHLGGDECIGYEVPKDFWSFLVDAAGRRGKQVIFWDEVLDAGPPREAAVQVWRHHALLDVALESGYASILSAPYYLDLMYPSELHHAFDAGGGLASRQAAQASLMASPKLRLVKRALDWFYGHMGALVGAVQEKLPSATAPGRILGAEACLWGELVGEAQLDTRLWSRLPAIANRLWLGAASVMPDRLETEAQLSRIAGIRIGPEAWLEGLKLNHEEQTHLLCLLDCLEPIKWYSRLLGEALHQRIEDLEAEHLRTYDADSPLDRAVDFVNPESLQAALFARSTDKREFAEPWRSQYPALEKVAKRIPRLQELLPLSRRLADLADIIDGQTGHQAFEDKHPDAQAPVAELCLAVLPLVIDWKLSEARNSAS